MKGDWKEVQELIDAGIIQVNDGYRAKNSEMNGDGLPFARAGNVNNGFHFDQADILSWRSVEKAKNKVSRAGDVVFTSKGTFGRFAFVGTDTPEFVYSPQLCYWRVTDTKTIYNRFLYYWMQSKECLDQMRIAKGLTDMADYVSLTNQRRMFIRLPPLETQQKIAGILSAYDDLIENNLKRIRILEDMARALYREWFVYFRFPGHEKVKFVDSPMGKIPEGWEVKKVGEVCEVVTGKTPSKSRPDYFDGSIPFVKIPDMYSGTFTLETAETLSQIGADTQKNKRIPAKSILVSCIGTIGLVCITTEDCQTNQQINAAIPYNDYMLEYLYFLFKDLKTELENLGSNGATIGNVNRAKFVQINILCPRNDILSAFNSYVKNLFMLNLKCMQKIISLKKSRDSLLPQLMAGRLVGMSGEFSNKDS